MFCVGSLGGSLRRALTAAVADVTSDGARNLAVAV